MWIHSSLHIQECRDQSEIYNYQRIQLLNNKFINGFLGDTLDLVWLWDTPFPCMGISRLPGLSLAINTGRPPYPILGDPGAVSRAGRKGERKGFKPRWKTPWVLTLTRDSHDRVSSCRVQTHEKNWGDAVHRLGTIIQSIFCAQSGASTRLTIIFWKWSGESQYPGALPRVLKNFLHTFSPSRLTAPGSPRMP